MKGKDNSKSKYGDSGFARMTTKTGNGKTRTSKDKS